MGLLLEGVVCACMRACVCACVCVCARVCACTPALGAQSYLTVCDSCAVARQGPLSMGFSRQEYWIWLPFPPPGDRPHPGIKAVSLVSSTPAGGWILYYKHHLWRRQWHPLQSSRLQNPRDRGAWWAAVHGVARVGHDWSDLQPQQQHHLGSLYTCTHTH